MAVAVKGIDREPFEGEIKVKYDPEAVEFRPVKQGSLVMGFSRITLAHFPPVSGLAPGEHYISVLAYREVGAGGRVAVFQVAPDGKFNIRWEKEINPGAEVELRAIPQVQRTFGKQDIPRIKVGWQSEFCKEANQI